MTQLNTPYPATAYLTGFLRQHAAAHDLDVRQADPAIELFLRIFSHDGLADIAEELAARVAERDDEPPAPIAHFLAHAQQYVATVAAVLAVPQGRDPALALRLATRTVVPEGPRFAAIANATRAGDGVADPLHWAFGQLGVSDRGLFFVCFFFV